MLGHLLRAFGDMNYYDDELLEGVRGGTARTAWHSVHSMAQRGTAQRDTM